MLLFPSTYLRFPLLCLSVGESQLSCYDLQPLPYILRLPLRNDEVDKTWFPLSRQKPFCTFYSGSAGHHCLFFHILSCYRDSLFDNLHTLHLCKKSQSRPSASLSSSGIPS